MRRGLGLFAVLCTVGVLASQLTAQDGGLEVDFCGDDPRCVDDTLEIVFENGTSSYDGPVEAGVEFPVRVVLDTKTEGVQGYSFAVRHDSSILSIVTAAVTTAGTIIDPANAKTAVRGQHFEATSVFEGGFFSAVLLSLREPASLPVQRNTICNAAYRFDTAPSCSVLRFVDGQLGVGSEVVGLNLTVAGQTNRPRELRHGLVGTGECSETCDDLVDNDGDGLVDCADEDCADEAACLGESQTGSCSDGVDNDGNGWIDCNDPQCRGDSSCRGPENCSDGIDNNGDGDVDCDDSLCTLGSICLGFEVCNDGTDNDGDGDVDCADEDCSESVRCANPEICDDGTDNDGDGLVDCDDSECRRHVACSEPEICDDGQDNDLDQTVDCLDPDCSAVGDCPFSPRSTGGVREDFCVGDDCSKASIEVVFQHGSSSLGVPSVGSEFEVLIVSEVQEPGIRGWAYSVQHDPKKLTIVKGSVTTDGTVVDRDRPGGLGALPDDNRTVAVDGAFISVIAYSQESGIELPVGSRVVLARARYQVLDNLNGLRIDIVDNTMDPKGGSIEIGMSIGESVKQPEALVHGLFQFTGGTVGENCSDGLDNNNNGLADCDEWVCQELGECRQPEPFSRGDVDGNGSINVTDVLATLLFVFSDFEPRFDCSDALDANDDDSINVSDALSLLRWLFQRGPMLPAPFLECGVSDGDCAEASPGCQ